MANDKENDVVEYFLMQSNTEMMVKYRITALDGWAVACSCKGFHYRGTCRHMTEFDEGAETEAAA